MASSSSIGVGVDAPEALVSVSGDICRDHARSSRLEWLETNGTGGFAMGTVAGTSTRRYHGLLVAPLRPPGERHVLLARLEESVVVPAGEVALARERVPVEEGASAAFIDLAPQGAPDKEGGSAAFIDLAPQGAPDKEGGSAAFIDLATNQYPGTLYPEGHRHLAGFRLDPFPTWTYEVDGLTLEKRLFLVHGEQTVVVRYRASRPAVLRVRPFLAFRDYHALTRANGALDGGVRETSSAGVRTLMVRPYRGLPELLVHHSGGRFVADGTWHRDTEYLEELERGLDFREDLWRMGTIEMQVRPGADAFVVATIVPTPVGGRAAVDAIEEEERRRRRSRTGDPLRARLDAAAEGFLVRRADGSPTVIAGYPWFTDWGRDTMIALPGLLLARGRLDEAREVIRGFLAHLRRGLIPNRFPDRGEVPEYNTVDGTLWLFQAVHAYLAAGGDPSFAAEVYPRAREIVRHHQQGTEHGIRVDPGDGLLVAGDAGAQLTWMDAKVGEWVVTPRHGKPVEVNALWYNALRLAAAWGRGAGDDAGAAELEREAERVARSFEERFWDASRGCLYDVILPSGPDRRLRPNQIFAVSLPYPLLDGPRRESVVRTVERALLTPVGLRTLAPDEPDYRPVYRGGPLERDGAYHQGAVWPWLLGPFVRAYLNAFGRTRETIAHCRTLLDGIARHLAEEGCLGSISEILEAEPPHRPVGAPAQAWSVAEVLHVLATELAPLAASKPRPRYVAVP